MKLRVITVVLEDPNGLYKTLESLSKINNSIECIVVNGGSDEATNDIVKQYKHLITTLIHEKDDGVYDAMNKGIRVSSGDIITFLNAGDLALQNYIKDIISSIGQYDYLYAGVNLVSKNGNLLKKIPKKVLPNTEYLQRMPFSHPGLAVRKHCFDKIGYFDTKKKYTADHQWIVKLIKSSLTGKLGEFVNVNFYLGGTSMSFFSIFEMMQTAREGGRNIVMCYIMLLYGLVANSYYRIFNN